MHASVIRSSALISSVLLTVGAIAVARTSAQTPPVCQPPNVGEYLVLVISPTEAEQAQLRETLPAGATSTVCTYLEDVVLRVGGFTSAETADAWTQSVDDRGLDAFVARPPAPGATALASPEATPSPTTPAPGVPAPAVPAAEATPVPTAPEATPAFPQPDPTPTPAVTPSEAAATPPAQPAAVPENSASSAAPAIAYNPQPLGDGYAVLIDYANRPEVAAEVRQILTRDVGLVAYGERPYLLAVYTSDPTVANTILRTLSDRNYIAMIIDSRRAVLLTESVR